MNKKLLIVLIIVVGVGLLLVWGLQTTGVTAEDDAKVEELKKTLIEKTLRRTRLKKVGIQKMI